MKKRIDELTKEIQKNRLEAFNLFDEAAQLQQDSRNIYAFSSEERSEMTRCFIQKQKEAISKLLKANVFEHESIALQRQLTLLLHKDLQVIMTDFIS